MRGRRHDQRRLVLGPMAARRATGIEVEVHVSLNLEQVADRLTPEQAVALLGGIGAVVAASKRVPP